MKKTSILIPVLFSSFLLASCGGSSSSSSASVPTAPSNLTATPSSGTVSLIWTGSGEATYRVHQAESSFAGVAITDYETLLGYTSAHVTTTSTEILELTNGTTYYFVVTALENSQESPASNEVIGLPDFPVPPAPTNLMATPSSGTVNLSWTGSDGATYKVHQAESPFGDADYETLVGYSTYNVTSSSIEITELTNNTTYYFVVVALIGDKESGVSKEASGLPEFPIPSTPTNLTAFPSSGTVSLTWTGSDGAHYKVYQSTATIISDDLSSYQSYNITESSIDIPGLTNGTSYYFVVVALIGDKKSPVSDEVIGLPDFPIPPVPMNVMATASNGIVNLNWDSVAGVSYKVYQSTGTIIADDLSSYQSYNITESSIEITNLTNNTNYYFVVTALANGKESPASNEVNGLPEFPVPPAPTNLIASVSSGTVALSWTGSDGVTYKVHQAESSFDDVANYKTLSGYASYIARESSIKIRGLTNNRTYYFVVTAVIGDKESGFSTGVSGFPEFPVPLTPTNLMVTPSSGTVNLSWTGSEGSTYKVHQAENSFIFVDVADYETTIPSYSSINVTANSIEISGLTNGRTYYFVITAVIGDKKSGVSEEIRGLPEGSLIAPPTNLMVIPSSGTVNLNWTGRDGATYEVHQAENSFDGFAVADYETLTSYTSTHVTTTSIEITGLTNGTRYYFVVTALANGKESGASNEVIGLPYLPVLSKPASLEVTSESSGTVNLSWNSIAGASYKVYQSTGTIIADDLSSYQSYEAITSSIEIPGLTNGTLYYFVVTALINGRESAISNQVSGFPDYPIPPEPTNLTVTSISSGAVYLSWIGSDGETYNVHQATQAFNTVVDYGDLADYQLTEVTTTSIKIVELTNDTTYYFVVTALANGKESPASDEVSATPFAPRPLNDTGITWGGHFPYISQTGTDCSAYAFDRDLFDATRGKEMERGTDYDFAAGTEQDCQQGRDAEATTGTLIKIGGGKAGFDFTKLGSTGTVLSIQDAAWSDSGSESLGTKWSCVRDNVTGAVWEVKLNDNTSIHDTSRTYEYEDSTWTALVAGSNQEGLCGYNDWRVPTIIELVSFIDLGDPTSAYDTSYFPNSVNNEAFWSSSLDAGNSNKAWAVLSTHRATVSVGRSSSTVHHLRLIRSSFTMLNQWPDYRYTDHGDGTVTDNVTGLMWAKCSLGRSGDDCGGSPFDWKGALEEASSSTLATYTDWRLPNRKELHSLVAYDRINESINSNRFPNTTSGNFWTSSPRTPGPHDLDSDSWQVDFSSGADYYGKRYFRYRYSYVRLVRSSQ